MPPRGAVLMQVRGLRLEHEGRLIQRGLDFALHAGEVLAIVGGSGSGKSTLLRALIGLAPPAAGQVLLMPALTGLPDARDLHGVPPDEAQILHQRFGVMFQSGALWSAMTVLENLTLPLELLTDLPREERIRRARAQLARVGLAGSEAQEPAALSGGMKKRVALARALMLKPPLVFLDEPAAGLDPLNTARLDALILKLSREEGMAVVLVTHDIPSVFAVADRMMFLDAQHKTMTALDAPETLQREGPPAVQAFLRAGREARDDGGDDGGDDLPGAPITTQADAR